MSNSVSENLFEAVNLLIDKKLSEVTFDTTLICEVIETNLFNKSEHIVKNNSMTFKAYSLNEETYFKGSKVYVTIPQGNYNLKKIILGEAKTDTLSAKSMRPLDSLLPLRSNNWLTSDTAARINEGQIVTITIENINTNLEIPKQFGIKAIFDSWIPTAIKGNYGLNIEVTDETGRQNLNTRFDSTEFYGNPYMYDDGFTVEKLFVLPSWAKKITFSKYINTFYDENNQEIELDGIDKYINLTDIVLQIGLDSSINENKNAPIIDLFLNDNQSLFYSSTETRVIRNINLILADANNSYLTTEDIEISPYEVRWFEYVPGYGVDLEAAGSNWKELVDNKNKIFYECEILPERANYQIKVLALQDGKLVTEKGLIFSNKNEALNDDLQIMSQNNLVITINGSKTHSGIFNVYNSKRKYIGESTNQTFQIGVAFNDLKEINADVDTIIWSLPSDTSLLTFSEVGNVTNLSAHINDYFEASNQYTTIRCSVKKDGITYHAEKLLSFGYKETQGTNYSVNLIPKDENGKIIRNIVSTEHPKIYVHAEVRDTYGNLLTNPGTWSWKFDKNQYNTPMTYTVESERVLITLNEGYDIITQESYCIIKYSVSITLENKLNIVLTGELPIIIVAPGYENYYIDGVTSVLISPMGGYDYTSSPYKFFAPDGMVQHNVEYSFAQQGDYFETTSSNQLQINNSIKTTYPIALKVQIYGIGTVWRQPILIQNDSYQSDILNQWNGNLEIGDKDHNYIMSSIIGAGFKDAENKFTGVFMGTVGKQFNNAVTGLYGFNAGEKTFSLDAETGNAFFKGDIYANRLTLGDNAYVDGTVYAKKGKIGNWLLNGDFIQSGNNPVSKGTSGIILTANSENPSTAAIIVRQQTGTELNEETGTYSYQDIVYLSATSSKIAGWNFDSYKMYNANNRWSTGLSTTGSDGDPAFWAGYVGKGSTPWESQKGWTTETNFYVTNTGFLKATNAEIEGKITANKGGKIGGWIIDAGQDYIKSGDNSIWLNGDGLGSYNGDSDVGKMIGLNSNDFTRNNAVLRLGSSPSTAKFILTNDGKIYATAGTIASLKLENNALYTLYQKGIDDEYYGDTWREDKWGGFGAEGLFYYSRNYKNDSLYTQTKFSISIQRLIDFIIAVEDGLWGTKDGSDYVEIKHIN